jgi:hypothetical protein
MPIRSNVSINLVEVNCVTFSVVIAAREGRSVAQVCEAFLKAGSESYKKKGSSFLQRFLAQPLSGPKDS